MDWSVAIQKDIYRRVVVHDDKLMICGCQCVSSIAPRTYRHRRFHRYCKAEAISVTQPALTQVCRAIHNESLPLYYRGNEFKIPIGHGCEHSVHDWLDAIGYENCKEIRHLELPMLSLDCAVETLKQQYDLQPARDSVIVEAIEWYDGMMGEVECSVFAYDKAESIDVSVSTSDVTVKSVAHKPVRADSAVRRFPSCISSTAATLGSMVATSNTKIPTSPPRVDLRRPNGEDWGEARWSSAPGLEAHFVRRLASLAFTLPKPLTLTFEC
jgi:hypothetical protein